MTHCQVTIRRVDKWSSSQGSLTGAVSRSGGKSFSLTDIH